MAYPYRGPGVPEPRIIYTGKPLTVGGEYANPPFAAGRSFTTARFALTAGQRVQPYQNGLPCQKVVVLNEGAGNLFVGVQGVSVNAPVTGTTPAAVPAFLLVSGSSLTVEIEDASYVYAATDTGTNFSIMVLGLSVPVSWLRAAQQQAAVAR